ncbi:2-amino-4-hydroxy-6-hydroxymethyldihydropteridine diphosphokinase [uncultured Clostridium sp.]|jgi:dihydroneopterin aldolase/2-amino-4-hydroxy-6-hydroxymethyldihydropteridine diphosphokinase|uniref:2-amino-4-hydroxy-6- hydroxymethyldihydropteridine diphosphokinase n=1 Tax=uncultured Clostridium sp. TaxID=59620 RepID=UPI002620A94C|nr:2-amino-4-hydroxy-6-hydroxymethyldihydropteridine diphosphokinase [uncultured Clostridium sp.]
MDKIVIKDFEVFGNHGVFAEEKTLGQKFVLDIILNLTTEEAAKTGDLTKSVHYGELAHKLEVEFKKNSYDLIETVAEKMTEFILLEYELVESVKIRVKKPWAPVHRTLDTLYVEIERAWNDVYLSFGSNMGDKGENIDKGLDIIRNSKYTKILKVSDIIVTKPWGYEDQDDFLNGACRIRTLLSPKALMKFLLEVEKDLNRERIIKWGPRTLDLDIIFYNDLVTEDEEVVLPHPRMHQREFVLKPLAQIAPYKIHSLYKKRVFELLELLEKNNSK